MTPHEREVMQQALSDFEDLRDNHNVCCASSMSALRACLAQPEQYDQTELALCKKCGWKAVWPDGCLICEKQEALVQPDRQTLQATGDHPSPCAKFCEATAYEVEIKRLKAQESGCSDCGRKRSDGWKLYCLACLREEKEWVGLTDEEIDAVEWLEGFEAASYARTIETKLREKNA